MSDLVERLRKEIVTDDFTSLMDEAAARVEALEAALRAISGGYDLDSVTLQEIARAALAE